MVSSSVVFIFSKLKVKEKITRARDIERNQTTKTRTILENYDELLLFFLFLLLLQCFGRVALVHDIRNIPLNVVVCFPRLHRRRNISLQCGMNILFIICCSCCCLLINRVVSTKKKKYIEQTNINTKKRVRTNERLNE